MSIPAFLSKQVAERKLTLASLHKTIVEADKDVVPEIGSMMGKEMILYKASGVMKYGLSSVKSHMSLHVMPMYGSTKIYSRYEKLLNKAKFQKGCINFKSDDEMPAEIVKQLIEDCAKVDLLAIMQDIKQNPEKKYF